MRRAKIQALDRTQPSLPMKKGRLGTMTHDHIRRGTTTLFAALNVLDGTIVGRNMQRHRHQEFNAVKGFFAKLSKRRLKRGSFHSLVDLQAAIKRFLGEHNRQPKPFLHGQCKGNFSRAGSSGPAPSSRPPAVLVAMAAPDALFMHCLPVHRGEEVTAEVIDGPQTVVFDEAENRMHAQKGVLAWALGAVR
jgi:hypothetical protein